MELVRGARALKALPRVVWLLGLASFLNDVSSEAIFPLLPMFLAQLGAPMRYLGLIEGSARRAGQRHQDDRGPPVRSRAAQAHGRGRLRAAGPGARGHRHRGGAVARADGAPVRPRRQGHPLGPRDAMLADSVPPTERGRAFGLNRSLDHLGAAVGPLIASALIALGAGLRATFVVAAVFGLGAPSCCSFACATPGTPRGRRKRPPRRRPRAAPRLLVVPRRVRAVRAGQLVRRVPARPRARGGLDGGRAAVALALPPPGQVDRRAAGRRAVRPALPRRRRRGGVGAYAVTYVGFGFATARWQIVVLFLAYALYHGLAEGAERAIIADLAERGGRGRASASTTASWASPRCPPAWPRASSGITSAPAGPSASTPSAPRSPRPSSPGSPSPGRLRRALVPAAAANPVRALPRPDE
jgi:hypothetical protein